tara:strand:+ start:1827 stop:2222 length:396 start_codon:yes stop_codon:yes gene_type:complete
MSVSFFWLKVAPMADRRPQLRSSPRSHGGSELQSYAAGKRQKPQETRLRLNKRGINRSAALWVLCRCRHKTHWTKHKSRFDREFGRKKWGDEGFAREELVAELGAAFLCADLELTPEVRSDHAAYIQNWLR